MMNNNLISNSITVEDEKEANFWRWREQAAELRAEYQKAEAGCRLLTGSDRVLMEMVIKGDYSCQELAKLLGKSHSSVVRRIRQLTAIILGHSARMVQVPESLKPEEAAVVRLAMVQGLSKPKIALRLGLTLYRVTRICQKFGIKRRTERS
jgi:DNA-binding CsgD family transcriptional regulator